MKKRIFTIALVVLFVMTLTPIVASAEQNLIEITSDPAGVDNPESHWGWSSRDGIDTLPKNMRGITGIKIEFDIDEGNASFVVQSPFNWWDQIDGGFPFTDGVLEINFEETYEDWEIHNKQYEMHLVFGNWDDSISPDNITGAWLIGEDLGAPQFAPGDENPVLAKPTVDDFGGHDHWGWSMEIGSLPWNMSEITAIVIEFDFEPGQVEFVVQSPAEGTGWWDHPGATSFSGNTLEIVFADWTNNWDAHIEQNMMHLVFGSWDGNVGPDNVVSAHLVGVVAEGIPNPEASEAREMPPVGTLPFDMGLGHFIWGDQFAQLGWNGDQRAIDGGDPFAGAVGDDLHSGGGLTAGLLVEAAWFVIYVDHAPDDEEAEMLQLTIFGAANDWSWSGGTMDAPTVQIYDTFVKGAIAFPIGGHPYIEAIKQAGEDEYGNRNFGISFQYGSGEDNLGGIENLGITGVWLYADLPESAEPEPAPAPEPTPAPATPEPVAPAPAPAASSGFPWWGWVLIAVGAAAAVVVVLVVLKKKK